MCLFVTIYIFGFFVTIFLVLAAANGVVIATEKKLPSILVDEASVSCFFFGSTFVHYY
jgi:hypothetical protein